MKQTTFESPKMFAPPILKPISVIGKGSGSSINQFTSNPDWLNGDEANSMNVFHQKSYPFKAPNKPATTATNNLSLFSSFDKLENNSQPKTHQVKIPVSAKKQPIQIRYEEDYNNNIYIPPMLMEE
jgi:hypothetical protein